MIYPLNPYTSDSTLLKSLIQNDLMVTPELVNPEINYTPLTLPQPSPNWLLNPEINYAPYVPTQPSPTPQPSPVPLAEGINPAPKANEPLAKKPAVDAKKAPVIDPKKAKLNELQRWQLLSLFSQDTGQKPEEEPPPQVTSIGGPTVSFPQGDLISLLSILGRSM